MLGFAILSVIFVLDFTSALNPYCDFVQNVQPGEVYVINNPNYPRSYHQGEVCRWITICPIGYILRLDCSVVVLPESPSCSVDRLLVSRNGDPYLYGAITVCGRNPFTITSTEQRLSFALVASNSTPGGYFSCKLYAQAATPITPPCRCGERKKNRIVGGQDAEVNEFRMMAGLVDVDKAEIKCGGAIISSRHVVTAAHCLKGEKAEKYLVLVGDHDISTGNDTNSANAYKIHIFITHPQYNPVNYDYDIAIVQTDTAIKFNDQVGPACLPFGYVNYDFTGSKLIILGWGTVSFGGPRPNILQKVTVDVISQAACRSYERNVTDRQLCTLTPGKDACQYDSGGPLLYTGQTNGLLYLVATVSYGKSCGSEYPAINTRMTQLLQWIVNTAKADFCKI